MNKKIKVLHIGLSYNFGGIESVVYSWLVNKPKNFQFDFINDDENNELAKSDELIKKGSNIFNITHRYKNPIKHIIDLNKIIRDGKYDFIHFHIMNNDEPWPIILGNRNKCKVIVHCHSLYKNKQTWKENLLKAETKIMLIKQKYLKLACSNEAGLNMFNSNEFTVIENGVDVSKYKYSDNYRDEIRKKYCVNKSDKIIGHVGTYSKDKNYPFILSTFSKVANNQTKLMLVGNIENEHIDKLIDDFGIKDNVIFTGKVNDVYKYYSAFDLYYMPSLSEGLPISSIEAQASGLQCLLSTGVPRSADVSENVYFINLNEGEAVSTINKLLSKKVDRNKVKFDKKYTIKESSKSIFSFYLSNLDES